MSGLNNESLEFLFRPRSVAFVGITTAHPAHWTRTFLNGYLEFGFKGEIYLVNFKGGEINGRKVYTTLQEIPDTVDFVIGLVPARLAPGLVEECAGKGVKAVSFGTSGFSEVGTEEGAWLEAELAEVVRRTGVRVIGPNCMGIYCPESRMSYAPIFPKDSGPVSFISQSGGNSMYLVRQASARGIRFSKVISYGNACDLNESDFLEYLATDTSTRIIAIYIEGVKDGQKFRRALEKAAQEKTIVLLKGGVTQAGARAVASHTAAIAGSQATWEALCRQLGIITVSSLMEMIDVLVTLSFFPVPAGRNVALVGAGGGASVLITDEFENKGLKVPPLPEEVVSELLEFTLAAGNILKNPIDYGQSMMDPSNVQRAIDIISEWDGIDFLVKFMVSAQSPQVMSVMGQLFQPAGWMTYNGASAKPAAVVLEPGVTMEETETFFASLQQCASARLPVYYSFGSAAHAINLVLNYYENRNGKQGI